MSSAQLMSAEYHLDAALALEQAGYSVVPTRADGTKAPMGLWREYQEHRPTADMLRRWYSQNPALGVGIITGHPAARVILLEIEGRAMHRLPEIVHLAGASGLADLWQRIQLGWTEQSPSGGIHWMLKVHDDDDIPAPAKVATRPSTRDELAANPAQKWQTLAEIKGAGGYCIVAPTAGDVHPDGGAWTRIVGDHNTPATVTVDELEQITAIIAAALDEQPEPATPAPRTTTTQHGNGGDRLKPGDDYENRTDWADILEPHGWNLVYTQGRTRYWRRPGKTIGISATTGHAEDRDRLYVFTSSTGFDTETPYTKFGALAVLEHGGDHAAAARALAAQGYGDKPQPDETAAQFLANLQHATAADTRPHLIAVPNLDTDQPEAAAAADPEEQPPLTPTWEPINLAPYLDGTYQPPQPSMFERADHVMLLYPGLVHDFHGESESGKSLLIQAETATRIQHGDHVLYIDFESDAGQIVNRLLAFGCTPAQISTHFTYIRPEGNPYDELEKPAWAAILTSRYSLAVLDGVTDALGQFGSSTKDNDEIAAWHRAIPRAIATRTGAAVVLIDHVTKSTDGRGRFAIGGQVKMAAIDGASYLIEVREPLGKGMKGVVTMRIGKDRPGEIRPNCGPYRADDRTQEAARVTIDSTGDDGRIRVTIAAPAGHVGETPEERDQRRYTGVMEKLSRLLELAAEPMSQKRVGEAFREDGGRARQTVVLEAIKKLTAEAYIGSQEGPHGSRELYHLRPYRQINDPSSDAYEQPVVTIGGQPA